MELSRGRADESTAQMCTLVTGTTSDFQLTPPAHKQGSRIVGKDVQSDNLDKILFNCRQIEIETNQVQDYIYNGTSIFCFK